LVVVADRHVWRFNLELLSPQPSRANTNNCNLAIRISSPSQERS